MPLWMTASRPWQSRCGCALASRHAAVGRPPGVPQGRVAARQLRRGLADLADVLFDQQPSRGSPVLVGGDPPRVVAAILELLQPGQHQLGGFVAATDVAEYAAHADHALLSGRRRSMRKQTPLDVSRPPPQCGTRQLTHVGSALSCSYLHRFVPPMTTVRAEGHPPSLSRSPSSSPTRVSTCGVGLALDAMLCGPLAAACSRRRPSPFVRCTIVRLQRGRPGDTLRLHLTVRACTRARAVCPFAVSTAPPIPAPGSLSRVQVRPAVGSAAAPADRPQALRRAIAGGPDRASADGWREHDRAARARHDRARPAGRS